MLSREYLKDLLDEDAYLIPGADNTICGVTPQGQPIYHYNLLVEYFMDQFRKDDPAYQTFATDEDLHVGAIEWVEHNIACHPNSPIVMYEIFDV